MDIFIDMIKMKKSGNNEPMLSVIDDGRGMNYEEIVKMVSFGHNHPDCDEPDRIGRFGVGFKVVFSFAYFILFFHCLGFFPGWNKCVLSFCFWNFGISFAFAMTLVHTSIFIRIVALWS